jgi:hypothetical protein
VWVWLVDSQAAPPEFPFDEPEPVAVSPGRSVHGADGDEFAIKVLCRIDRDEIMREPWSPIPRPPLPRGVAHPSVEAFPRPERSQEVGPR